MIGYFAAFSAVLSLIYACLAGNTSTLTAALLSEPVEAVNIAVYLTGGLCFWSGLMKIAEKSGVTEFIAKILKAPLKLIFSDVQPESRAFRYICMNISANMLGLGNAATPLGIEAMKALDESAPETEVSDDQILFAVTNTASLTIIPSTMASLRLKYGAQEPFDVMPAVILTSLSALTVSIITAKTGCIIRRIRRKGK